MLNNNVLFRVVIFGITDMELNILFSPLPFIDLGRHCLEQIKAQRIWRKEEKVRGILEFSPK